MKIVYNNAHMRSNFLELAENISNEDSKALMHLDNLGDLKERFYEFSTPDFPIDKIMLIFHRYACIAYLSAEFIVNAKLYLDGEKKDYILLSYIKESEPDAMSIVYSNISGLSQYPTFPITVKELIAFMESDNVVFDLINYYRTNVKK